VIGITCEQIEDWRPVKLNPWVQEEIHYKTLRQRLFALIDGCDAALVLPGGIGTLTEIIFFWDELAIKASRRRPLIAIGSEWKTILDTFCDLMSSYIPDQIPGMITYAPDVKTAFSLLRQDPNWPATSDRNQ
jgi:predicted Rossmann-fold nucleotide-binding protein